MTGEPIDLPEAETRPRRPLLGTLEAHVGLVIAAIGLTTVVLKLVSASHGDVGTMGAIVQAAGSADIVVASILSGAASLSGATLIVAIPTFAEAVRERYPLKAPTVMLLVSLGLTAMLAPANQLVALCVILGFMGSTSFVWAWVSHRRGRPTSGDGALEGPGGLAVGLGVLAALLWILIATSSRMWLPAERFNLRGGDVVVGYSLSSEGNTLVVLRERDRAVERVNLDSIDRRSYCRLDDADPRTVLNLISGQPRPRYAACPESDR